MPHTVSIQPLQWSGLPELHETPPLDASDHACMVELASVLAKHGKLKRFALHLAHKHFDLAPGEVLIEQSDPHNRSQQVTVGRLDQIEYAVPTTWMLDTAPDMLASAGVYCVCIVPPYREACVRHGKSHSPGEGALREWAKRDRRIAEDKAKYEEGFGRPEDREPDLGQER